MTRQAQLAQFPTLVRLSEGQAVFRDGEQLTITVTAEAWKAMGRPVDLQVIATPKPAHTVASAVAAGGFADVLTQGMTPEDADEYVAQNAEAREGLEAGL